MTEKIKAEIELIPVWVKAVSGAYVGRWATKEMIEVEACFVYADHINADVQHIMMQSVDTNTKSYTTEDPGKTPEWMPEGCELWEYGIGDGAFAHASYRAPDGEYRTASPNELGNLFHAFAVKAGDGTVHLMNTPNWFTHKKNLSSETYTTMYVKAKILGAVMRKAD